MDGRVTDLMEIESKEWEIGAAGLDWIGLGTFLDWRGRLGRKCVGGFHDVRIPFSLDDVCEMGAECNSL